MEYINYHLCLKPCFMFLKNPPPQTNHTRLFFKTTKFSALCIAPHTQSVSYSYLFIQEYDYICLFKKIKCITKNTG